MATVDDLADGVLQRLEERPEDPVFWSRAEVRNLIAEGLCESMLLSAEPEVRSETITLVKEQTYQAMPADAFAITRMEASQGPVRKEYLFNLDRMNPTWQGERAGQPKHWLPLGLGPYFAIYPQVIEDVQAILHYVAFPVVQRPYRGDEPIPYQTEYHAAIEEYATHVARMKEGGAEFAQSIPEYDNFLLVMSRMSSFADRKNIGRFSLFSGVPAKVNDVETK